MGDRSGSQASGGLVSGRQSGGQGLDSGRVVRQAGVWYRESDRAGGARGEQLGRRGSGTGRTIVQAGRGTSRQAGWLRIASRLEKQRTGAG